MRNSKLGYAIKQFDYVINRAKSDCKILAEILYQKAKILFLRGKNAEAIAQIYHVIKLKPDYISGYVYLAEFYKKNGTYEDASKIVKIGLKRNPNSRRLKQLYEDIKSITKNK